MFTAEQLNVITTAVWVHCRALAQMEAAEQREAISKTEAEPQNLREAVRTTLGALMERHERREWAKREREVLDKLNGNS